jgi:hypothetical protein
MGVLTARRLVITFVPKPVDQALPFLKNMNPLCNRPTALRANKGREMVAIMITKILVSAAIALGSCVGGAAAAGAEGTDANPFGALGCGCRETAPPGSSTPREEMERGIWAGIDASPGDRSQI